jgi:hypothetical protein
MFGTVLTDIHRLDDKWSPFRNAFILGIQYLAFEVFPIIFMKNHGFNLQMTGLTFLGIAIGFFIGLATTPYWNGQVRPTSGLLVRPNSWYSFIDATPGSLRSMVIHRRNSVL